MAKHEGTCPKCNQHKKLTRHHVHPKTHYGGGGKTELICRDCHDELEYFIEQHEGRNKKGRRIKLPKVVYETLFFQFIGQA